MTTEANIRAAAARLDIELLPWQVDAAVAILEGRAVVFGKSVGRRTIMRIIEEATCTKEM